MDFERIDCPCVDNTNSAPKISVTIFIARYNDNVFDISMFFSEMSELPADLLIGNLRD